MQLYHFCRSSAAYRVRIALNLKGVAYDMTSIHLQKEGGMNKKPEFRAINPHMRLVLQVTDAKGTRDISFEGHSTNNMYRAGYRNGMIKVGDKISVTIAPTRDGSDGGYVTAAVTASGARFGLGSGADQTQERTRAESK